MTPSAAAGSAIVPPASQAADERCAGDLARLVVKSGVGLGGLPAGTQALALAWVWAGLPREVTLTEPQVNAALKAQLAEDGAAAWLATDHVELRRWLVDGGWLQRDGYGRAYRSVSDGPTAHAERVRAVRQLLQGTDTATWTAQRRAAEVARRDARRSLWEGTQAVGAQAATRPAATAAPAHRFPTGRAPAGNASAAPE